MRVQKAVIECELALQLIIEERAPRGLVIFLFDELVRPCGDM